MSIHETTKLQILFDRASNYIVTHASAAGLDVLPPVWDDGSPSMTASLHHVRIATRDSEVVLSVPQDWLPLDSAGHNRFRAEVETVIAQLIARRRSRE
jgi:hypothetical protein